ncbi:hypothetical protein M3Y96_00118200 [Aphelenchoides besseyi]|nr:hypothetical protein M3Y96_00118200 [Aphelenchoides besseyi]
MHSQNTSRSRRDRKWHKNLNQQEWSEQENITLLKAMQHHKVLFTHETKLAAATKLAKVFANRTVNSLLSHLRRIHKYIAEKTLSPRERAAVSYMNEYINPATGKQYNIMCDATKTVKSRKLPNNSTSAETTISTTPRSRIGRQATSFG